MDKYRGLRHSSKVVIAVSFLLIQVPAANTAPARLIALKSGSPPAHSRSDNRRLAASLSTPDLPADYLDIISEEDGIFRWPAERFPLKVFIGEGSGVPGYRDSFRGMVRAGFDAWAQASGYRVAWMETRDRRQADVVVSWIDTPRERMEGTEAGNTKTYTLFDTETNEGIIRRATMDLLTRLPEREFSDAEMRRICLHEVGHAFGLAGHSPDPKDIMFGAVRQRQQATLSQADVATIVRLYSHYMPVSTAVAPRQVGVNRL